MIGVTESILTHAPRMEKGNVGRLCAVRWNVGTFAAGWTEKAVVRLRPVITIGWVREVTERAVLLAPTRALSDDGIACSITIPRGAVVGVTFFNRLKWKEVVEQEMQEGDVVESISLL